MPQYASWLKALPVNRIIVGYPARLISCLDLYLYRFAAEPFSVFALDVNRIDAMLKKEFHEIVKSNMPTDGSTIFLIPTLRLTIAISQGALFGNMLAENTTRSNST